MSDARLFTKMPEPVLDPKYSIANGDELININSFDYLRNLSAAVAAMPEELKKNKDVFNQVAVKCNENTRYDQTFAYGNLYTEFLLELENTIEPIITQRNQTAIASNKKDAEKKIAEIGNVLIQVYANKNQALERTANMMQEKTKQPSISKNSLSKVTAILTRKKGDNLNKNRPEQAGSLVGLAISNGNLGTFKPQTVTGMVSIKLFKHQEFGTSPVEYRMGTQGQYHNYQARVSPLFEAALIVLAYHPTKDRAKDGPIQHLYINNLARDAAFLDVPKQREAALTAKLDELEGRHDNVAVITLPADNGIMSHEWATDRDNKSIDYQDAKAQMLAIVTGESEGNNFYISTKVKELLYKDTGINEKQEMGALVNKSFEKLGIKEGDQLSKAQMQAVLFDVRYEVTNFLIETLKPESINMSCKEGIDRGAASSAYYNLMKSIERGGEYTMTEAEFTQALHAASIMVKGRGMNDHYDRIWNAVDTYITGQEKLAKENKTPVKGVPDWLITWRNKNQPEVGLLRHSMKAIKSVIGIRPAVPAKPVHESSVGINHVLKDQPKKSTHAYVEKIYYLKTQLEEIQKKLTALDKMIAERPEEKKSCKNQFETIQNSHQKLQTELAVVVKNPIKINAKDEVKKLNEETKKQLGEVKKNIERSTSSSSKGSVLIGKQNVNEAEGEGVSIAGNGKDTQFNRSVR